MEGYIEIRIFRRTADGGTGKKGVFIVRIFDSLLKHSPTAFELVAKQVEEGVREVCRKHGVKLYGQGPVVISEGKKKKNIPYIRRRIKK